MIILDMPPVLVGDDVISVLPQIELGVADCQHRDVDVARHQGVLQTHQIHTDRTGRGQ